MTSWQASSTHLAGWERCLNLGRGLRLSPCAVRRFALILFSTGHVTSLARRQPGLVFFSSLSGPLIGLRCRLRRRHWRFVFRRGSRRLADRFGFLFLWLSLLSTSFVSAAHDACSFLLFQRLPHHKIVVDRCQYVWQYGPVSQKLYTTVEVSRMTKIPRATLQYWIATRKISAPRVRLLKGRAARLWNEAQVEKARKLKGTLKKGPKP